MSKYIKNPINKKLLSIIKSFDEVESIIFELDSDNDFMLYINKNKEDKIDAKIVLVKSELYKAKYMEYLDYRISLALIRALEDIMDKNEPSLDSIYDFKKELERKEFKNEPRDLEREEFKNV